MTKVVNRDSTSSEDDMINSSGEFVAQEQINNFLINARNEIGIPGNQTLVVDDREPVQTDRNKEGRPVEPTPQQAPVTLESRVNEYVHEAEASRAQVAERTGNDLDFVTPNQFMKMAVMDEDYLIVAAHVDENMERRIRNVDYIDFSRLLPRDRVQMQLENRVELINQNGHLTCAPLKDNSVGNISSFA